MKKCKQCEQEKPSDDFYKSKQAIDGLSWRCKECLKQYAKNIYLKNKSNDGFMQKERARCILKYHKLYSGKSKVGRKYANRHSEKYPEKYKAANSSSKMIKPFEGAEKHHWSYNEEHYKDVIWLTKKEHMKGHRFIVYDQERMMYRRFDNNLLLDTKEEHELFIKDCIKNQEN